MKVEPCKKLNMTLKIAISKRYITLTQRTIGLFILFTSSNIRTLLAYWCGFLVINLLSIR